MKKQFLTLAVLFSFNLFGQDKIIGFGKLKLGMALHEIIELNKVEKISKSDQYYSIVYGNKSKNAFEIVCDTLEEYPQGYFDIRVRKFQIGNFDLTDKINVEDITLKFFKDTLFFIQIGDSKIKELLNTKYGVGKITLKEEDLTFKNGYGVEFIKTNKTYTTRWDAGSSNINLTYTFSEFYTSSGKQLFVYYAILQNISHNSDIELTDSKVQKRIEKNKANKKKADLSDF